MLRSLLFTLLFWLPLLGNANTILLVGDSLSAGYGIDLNQTWAALLEQRLAKDYPHYQLINDSISGDTTSNGLARLPDSLKKYQPKIIIIEYGGNDGLRGLSLTAMKQNLSQMINLARQQGAKVVLIGVRLPPNYGPDYTQAFHQTYPDLGKQFHITVVDKFLDDVGGKPELMQADGMHPNALGQPFLFNRVWQGLQPLL